MQQLSQTSEHLSHQLSPGQDEPEFKNTVLHDTQSIKGTMVQRPIGLKKLPRTMLAHEF